MTRVGFITLFVIAGCGLISAPDRTKIVPVVGTGGSVGGSGGAGECTEASDCPATDAECTAPACNVGICGEVDVDAGTPCSELDGNACDGIGHCVECVADEQCTGDDVCGNENLCVPGQCVNRVADGDETDIDCGGATCIATCEIGQACMMFSDCVTGYCFLNICGSCSTFNDCQVGNYCDAGVCTPRKTQGDACNAPSECESDSCRDGYCCDTACDEECRSCAVSASEGTCTSYGAGMDPDQDCPNSVCGVGGVCECGDGAPDAGEECDDGNQESFDGCSAYCTTPTGHLVISEVVTHPTISEYIEIYNPTANVVDLSTYYLADFSDYHTITAGPATPAPGDFVAQFPATATIAPGEFVQISLESAQLFQAVYGSLPSYDMVLADALAPAMLLADATATLDDAAEMVILFRWDGVATEVSDVDYLTYGNTSQGVDKTGLGNYLPDTALVDQIAAPTHFNGYSLTRCDTGENNETATGGNGLLGHDETSEPAVPAFVIDAVSPLGAPVSTACQYPQF